MPEVFPGKVLLSGGQLCGGRVARSCGHSQCGLMRLCLCPHKGPGPSGWWPRRPEEGSTSVGWPRDLSFALPGPEDTLAVDLTMQ